MMDEALLMDVDTLLSKAKANSCDDLILACIETACGYINQTAKKLGKPIYGDGGCIAAWEVESRNARWPFYPYKLTASAEIGMAARDIEILTCLPELCRHGDQVSIEAGLDLSVSSVQLVTMAQARIMYAIGRASAKSGKYSAASLLAAKRHVEDRAIADDVRRFWKENIDPKLSAQKAADIVVQAKLVPLSHKKTAEIISRLRKVEALRKK